MSVKLEYATFGAGCFWGVEAAFRAVAGVVETKVGYAGGTVENPTYQDVCGGRSGHAEVVQVQYNPERVSYEQLLELFWEIHDPTTLNRQGPDIGAQYRSVIFCHTPEQQAAALAFKEKLEASRKYQRPILTEIQATGPFYPAEEYHQCYLEKRGRGGCHHR
jgi:peptide-methionine (S)-S-oxide reductase